MQATSGTPEAQESQAPDVETPTPNTAVRNEAVTPEMPRSIGRNGCSVNCPYNRKLDSTSRTNRR